MNRDSGHARTLDPSSTPASLRVRAVVLAVLVLSTGLMTLQVRNAPPASAGPEACYAVNGAPVGALDGSTAYTAEGGQITPSRVTHSFAPAPAALPLLTATGAGGAAAGTGAAGTPVIAGVLGFLSGFAGGCKFMDWVTNDGALHPSAPATAPSTATVGAPQYCGALYGAPSPSVGTYKCLKIDGLATAGGEWSGYDVSGSWTYGRDGVHLNTGLATDSRSIDGTAGTKVQAATVLDDGWCSIGASPSPAAGCQVLRNGTLGSGGTDTWLSVNCGSSLSGYTNVGGVCGMSAEYQVGFICKAVGYPTETGTCPGVQYRHILNIGKAWVGAKGWQRFLHTQVSCKPWRSGSATWYTANSDPFWDKEPTARIVIPTCPEGHIPTAFHVFRVPVNLPVPPNGWSGMGLSYGPLIRPVLQWTAPSLWTGTTAPEEAKCFAVAAPSCITSWDPVADTCVIAGGTTVASSVCSGGVLSPVAPADADLPTILPAPSVVSAGVWPTTTPTVITAPYEEGQPISTVTPEPDPSSTTTATPTTTGSGTSTYVTVQVDVSIPIDDDGETAPRTATDPCWPSGWGWFNPLSWVLQPIKCAIQWAFVPEAGEVDARLADFEPLLEQPPLQWADSSWSFVSGSSVSFARWADAGPNCFSAMDASICPRDWDMSPNGLIDTLVVWAAWSMLVLTIVRYFR